MLRKTIKFTDFNGVDQVEEAYFHISEPEVVRLELEIGGIEKVIERWEKNPEEHAAEVMDLIEKIIKMSYGVKSEDGYRFKKDPETQKRFFESNAYNTLFMELLTDPDGNAIISLFNGILPQTKK